MLLHPKLLYNWVLQQPLLINFISISKDRIFLAVLIFTSDLLYRQVVKSRHYKAYTHEVKRVSKQEKGGLLKP